MWASVGAAHVHGLDGISTVCRVLFACVIQRPQSGIQRETTDAELDIETVIEIEMIGLDAEYEALVAEHSAALV